MIQLELKHKDIHINVAIIRSKEFTPRIEKMCKYLNIQYECIVSEVLYNCQFRRCAFVATKNSLILGHNHISLIENLNLANQTDLILGDYYPIGMSIIINDEDGNDINIKSYLSDKPVLRVYHTNNSEVSNRIVNKLNNKYRVLSGTIDDNLQSFIAGRQQIEINHLAKLSIAELQTYEERKNSKYVVEEI